MPLYCIGLMSGTSADGIDAVLVEIGDRSIEIRNKAHTPYPASVRERIESLVGAGAGELHRASTLDIELGRLFAAAANSLRRASGLEPAGIRAIGSHGQTLRHHPEGPLPYTVQIANPSVIAELTGITVVADFRARDIAAGGQGAPLVPAFHDWLFRKPGTHRVIVNIGGLANVTILPAMENRSASGFDTGPGNTLLDLWTRLHQGVDFDSEGAWAATGSCCAPLLESFLSDPYFLRLPPKSTGREYFDLEWLQQKILTSGATASPADVQATLSELTARSIAQAIRQVLPQGGEIYLCGGGTHNRDLVGRIARELPGLAVMTTSALGLDPDWVEAAAFGWLAHRTLEGLPGNLPEVTGASHPVILGGIYLQGKSGPGPDLAEQNQ